MLHDDTRLSSNHHHIHHLLHPPWLGLGAFGGKFRIASVQLNSPLNLQGYSFNKLWYWLTRGENCRITRKSVTMLGTNGPSRDIALVATYPGPRRGTLLHLATTLWSS
ncbi:hypothetical protein LguiB_020827 [Lonicera macranthoides]